MRQLDWPQIQAFILRGYALTSVCYFVLQVTDAAAARSFLGRLVDGAATTPLQLTTAAVWAAGEPQLGYALNVGITWTGLLALGAGALPDLSFRSFPAFVAGSAARASVVGDTGPSAPEHWAGGLGSGNDHLLLSLFAPDGASLESLSGRLRQLFEGALRELFVFTGGALPGGRVHFGYRDGISQPTIKGGPSYNIPDAQPVSPAWNFVLLETPAPGTTFRRRSAWASTATSASFASSARTWPNLNASSPATDPPSTPSYSRPRCAAAGATGFPWPCRRLQTRPNPPVPQSGLAGARGR